MHRAVLLLLAMSASAGTAGTDSAREAARALSEAQRKTIVRIDGADASPNPASWQFLCRSNYGPEGLVEITVRRRQIVAQKPAPSSALVADTLAPIDLPQVVLDSRSAFEIARRYVAVEKKAELGRATMQLTQHGEGAPPIWSLWCFTPRNQYLGLLKILSPNGHVVQWE